MFRDRTASTERTAAGFSGQLRTYDSTPWWDGTIHSVDKRLGECTRLLTAARNHLASDTSYVPAATRLAGDHKALEELRETLLTRTAERKAAPQERTAATYRALSGPDHRWVELTAARFVAEHGHPDAEEMAERARHYAERATSTFSPSRSQAVTAAFVKRATALRPRPQAAQKVAAAPVNAPDAALFL